MTRKRFFACGVDAGDELVVLKGQTAHHVVSVLRLRAGDSIETSDGDGNAWRGIIKEIGSGEVRIQLIERIEAGSESPVHLTLALSFSRMDRMDLALRQATELGASRFVAFRSRRSQYGLNQSQIASRLERWRKIAREALCQCGRIKLPEILVLTDVVEFISAVHAWEEDGGESLKMLALEETGRQSVFSVRRSVPAARQAFAVVGPEGGWEREEVDRFDKAGFHKVHLGPRILRLETAATVFLAAVQLLWGDLGDNSAEGLES